jgi:hypothetical protein
MVPPPLSYVDDRKLRLRHASSTKRLPKTNLSTPSSNDSKPNSIVWATL